LIYTLGIDPLLEVVSGIEIDFANGLIAVKLVILHMIALGAFINKYILPPAFMSHPRICVALPGLQ
jgi:hypothetical protein